ncbi:hypothetical protein [Xylanimonas oleitrophica]|nr:hypothetical protein [Xylanimonas oleitrophica]
MRLLRLGPLLILLSQLEPLRPAAAVLWLAALVTMLVTVSVATRERYAPAPVPVRGDGARRPGA